MEWNGKKVLLFCQIVDCDEYWGIQKDAYLLCYPFRSVFITYICRQNNKSYKKVKQLIYLIEVNMSRARAYWIHWGANFRRYYVKRKKFVIKFINRWKIFWEFFDLIYDVVVDQQYFRLFYDMNRKENGYSRNDYDGFWLSKISPSNRMRISWNGKTPQFSILCLSIDRAHAHTRTRAQCIVKLLCKIVDPTATIVVVKS